jgi:hypothetical protein
MDPRIVRWLRLEGQKPDDRCFMALGESHILRYGATQFSWESQRAYELIYLVVIVCF